MTYRSCLGNEEPLHRRPALLSSHRFRRTDFFTPAVYLIGLSIPLSLHRWDVVTVYSFVYTYSVLTIDYIARYLHWRSCARCRPIFGPPRTILARPGPLGELIDTDTGERVSFVLQKGDLIRINVTLPMPQAIPTDYTRVFPN